MRCVRRLLVLGSAFLSWILFPVYAIGQEAVSAGEKLNCLLNAVDLTTCYQAEDDLDLPKLREPQDDRETFLQRVKSLAKYRVKFGDGFSFGAQRYVKDFGTRGKTLGFGKELESSSLTVDFHKPGLSWMKQVDKGTHLNFRVGKGGEYGSRGQIIFGIESSW